MITIAQNHPPIPPPLPRGIKPFPGMDFVIKPGSMTDHIDLSLHLPPGRPLEVDVGCGKGRFLSCKAAANPDVNFIGIERMIKRVRRVTKKIDRAKLTNVRILRMEAAYAVGRILPDASVSTYYFFFPDPWPKRRHHGNRLINVDFINSLVRTLKPGGRVNVATDHLEYHAEIEKLFQADVRFTQVEAYVTSEDERTEFETIYTAQGLPIGRSSFVLKTAV